MCLFLFQSASLNFTIYKKIPTRTTGRYLSYDAIHIIATKATTVINLHKHTILYCLSVNIIHSSSFFNLDCNSILQYYVNCKSYITILGIFINILLFYVIQVINKKMKRRNFIITIQLIDVVNTKGCKICEQRRYNFTPFCYYNIFNDGDFKFQVDIFYLLLVLHLCIFKILACFLKPFKINLS